MTDLALVEQPSRSIVIPPPAEAREIMRNLQEVMQAVLEDSDYAVIQGKKWRKRSGFTKLRRVFSVSIAALDEQWEELPDGEFGCSVSVRASFPDGRYEDGDGYCDSIEMKRGRIACTRHNVRAKARTRAKNRATADLLGTGEVSAEELTAYEYHEEHRPTPPRRKAKSNGNGRPLSAEQIREVVRKKAQWQDGSRLLDGEPITEKQTGFVAGLMGKALPNLDSKLKDKARHEILNYLWGVASTSKLMKAEASATIDWLSEPGTYEVNQYATAEVAAILRELAIEAGQQEMPL